MAIQFDVVGPFDLPRGARGGVATRSDELADFWDEVDDAVEDLSEACGCYVFAVRSGGGAIPWYVGKADKQPFWKEVCAPHKLNKYNQALDEYDRGSPIIYLVPALTPSGVFAAPSSSKKGRPLVEKLEDLLIGMALQRNPELVNIKGLAWLRSMSFPGVIGPKIGKPTNDLSSFVEMMGIDR